MQVSLEKTSTLERRLAIVIPAKQIEDAINKRVQEMSRKMRLKGFRPGKVPVKFIKTHYGTGVRQEVLEDQIKKAYSDALSSESLNPASLPSIETKSDIKDKDFEFTATFEVYPSIELKDFSDIQVEQPEVSIDDKDIDKIIDMLRTQAQKFEDVPRSAQKGDQVILDFTGTKDNIEFEGGKAEKTPLTIGSNSFIPGFEDGLIGLSAGDEKTINITFPKDYHSEELKGKEVQFACKIHQVQEAKKPELNEDFFALHGGNEKTEEAFRAAVHKNMRLNVNNTIKDKIKEQVFDGLFTSNNIEVPKAIIKQESETLKTQFIQTLSKQGNFSDKATLPDIPLTAFEGKAKKRIALGLLVSAIIEKYKIDINNEGKIKEKIKELASNYENPQEAIEWYSKDQKELEQIQHLVAEDQVVDFLLAKAQVTNIPMTYEEAIKKDSHSKKAESTPSKSNETENNEAETASQ